jgi:hypothetical protein
MLATRSSYVPIQTVERIESSKIVYLDPRGWVGKRFILLDYIDIGKRLASGRWLILFHRIDCDHCQRALPAYEKLAEELRRSKDPMNVAVLEVPPYVVGTQTTNERVTPTIVGKLSDSREWLIETPLRVELLDGDVVAFASGLDAQHP